MPKINLCLELGQIVWNWMELSRFDLQPKEVGWPLTHSFAKEQIVKFRAYILRCNSFQNLTVDLTIKIIYM